MRNRQTIDLTLSDDEVIDLTRYKSPSVLSVGPYFVIINVGNPLGRLNSVDLDEDVDDFFYTDTLPIVKLNHSWREVKNIHLDRPSGNGSSSSVRFWDSVRPFRYNNGNELLPLRADTRPQYIRSGSRIPDTRRFWKKDLLHQTKEASGAITKIAQAPGIVAAASSAWGGNADSSQGVLQPPDPYNQEGNLNIVHNNRGIKLSCHDLCYTIPQNSNRGAAAAEYHKFYTVNDLTFCPANTSCMISTGNDRKLYIWDISEDCISDGVKEPLWFTYKAAPTHVAFKPQSSVIAVACGRSVYVHTDLNDQRQAVVLNVALPRGACGDFRWGSGNTLFASSEDDLDKPCQHIAADVETGKTLYRFSTDASGDALALDKKLDCLALITRTLHSHQLQLYDVRRGNGRHPITQVPLAASHRADVEVTHVEFSPDDILLALGRNDHLIDIYDVRFMGEPIQTFKQNLENRCLDKSREWGITGLHWTSESSRGVISAGSDGCVRLWDVGHSSNSLADANGHVIVQVDHDIACINVGDPWKREYSLVVGDSGGGVYLYD